MYEHEGQHTAVPATLRLRQLPVLYLSTYNFYGQGWESQRMKFTFDF